MRLVGAEVSRFSLPLRHPLRGPSGAITRRAGSLLRVFGECDRVGIGEASPAYWLGGHSLEQTAAALTDVIGVAAQATAVSLRERFLVDGALARRSLAAACALDNALLDLEARAAGVPIAHLFADDPAFELAVSRLLSGDDEGAVARAAEEASRAGFAAVKLKVGADTADDARRVAAARHGAGEKVELRLDANRAWSLDEAHRFLDLVAPYGPAFVEEPLRDPSPASFATLRKASGARIALDESLVDGTTLEAHAAVRGAEVFVVKSAAWGGITAAVAAGRHARRLGFDVVATDSIETSVGAAAALQLAAALSPAPAAVGLGGRAFLEGDVVADPDRLPGGPRVRLPGPGLGVRFERESTNG
jgi:muconate cycloisomerase/chloromuconate cycloisomerase